MSKENRRTMRKDAEARSPEENCLNLNIGDFRPYHGTFRDDGGRTPISQRSFFSMGYCVASGSNVEVIGRHEGGIWHAQVSRADLAITERDGIHAIDLGYDVAFHPKGSSGYNFHNRSLTIATKSDSQTPAFAK